MFPKPKVNIICSRLYERGIYMYHYHCYDGKTSKCDGHRHCYEGGTTLAPSGVPHIHYVVGYTTCEDGHVHYYLIKTSRECETKDGHFHYICGVTKICEDHCHYIEDRTAID